MCKHNQWKSEQHVSVSSASRVGVSGERSDPPRGSGYWEAEPPNKMLSL